MSSTLVRLLVLLLLLVRLLLLLLLQRIFATSTAIATRPPNDLLLLLGPCIVILMARIGPVPDFFLLDTRAPTFLLLLECSTLQEIAE